MTYQIQQTDRTFIVGQTESGKTYVAERILAPAERLVVIDSKGNLRNRFKLRSFDSKARRLLSKGKPVRVQITQPILDLNDLPLYYEPIFKELLEYGDLTVYIDETSRVTGYRSTVLAYFGAMYTQGRELNKVGVVASVQRPSLLPLVMISEAQHLFAFRLNMDADRKRMSESMGLQVREPIPDKHGFWYKRVDMLEPVYYPKFPKT